MLLRLDTAENFVRGETIDPQTVKEMVDAYRKRPDVTDKHLRYSHFSVKEILDFFTANGVLNSYDLNQPTDIEGFGLRIYIGYHDKIDNCPPNNPEYQYFDTTILCNTVIVDSKKGKFYDKLNKNNFIAVPGRSDDDSYLDQTYICPPTCPDDCEPDPETGYCLSDIGRQ